MTTFLLIFLAVLFLALVYCFYMMYRNDKVCSFRHHLLELVFMPDGDYMERLRIYKQVSYDYMLYSMKPLRLDSFFTVQEMEILVGFSNSEQNVQASVATDVK